MMLAFPLLATIFVPQEAPVPAYPDHSRLLVVRDAGGHERPVRNADDWAVRRGHIRAHMQEVMGPFPGEAKRVPLDVRVVETIDEPTYTRIGLTYQAEPGDRVPAWLLVPKGIRPGERRPAMLCLHQTTAIGKDEPVGLGPKPNLHYARELAGRGYLCLAPDYPRFGAHKVDPYALGHASATMKAILDNVRGVDLLVGRDDVDPDRIGVIGHSLGGHNALFTAAFDERLKAVVSSCGFTAFPRYKGGDLTGWSHDGYMPRIRDDYGRDPKRMPFDFPEVIAAIAPRAVFANAPTRDDNFDVTGVRECLDAARPVFELLGVGDRLAATYPEDEHTFPPRARDEAYAFLDRVLRGR